MKKLIVSIILGTTLLFGMSTITVHAESRDAKIEMYGANIDHLIRAEGESVAYQYILNRNGAIPHDMIQKFMNAGYLTEYADELRNLGYIDADYYPPGTSAPAPTETSTTETPAEPAPQPEAFTVEPVDPNKTMWATNDVNLRAGASTQYDKTGSLSQYDEVTVTGVASTGWYEINKDGVVYYVSNNFLTEEDPHNRTEYIYDENEKVVKTYEFTDADPELIDQKVEELKEESKLVEEPETIEEPETESVSRREPVEEPETEVVEEKVKLTERLPLWKICGFTGILLTLLVLIVHNAYHLIKAAKENRKNK